MRYKKASKEKRANWEWFVKYNFGVIKCDRCGYEGIAIDVHHIHPRQQKKHALDTFALNIQKAAHNFKNWVQGINYALLCSNCHRELHSGAWKISEIMERVYQREIAQRLIRQVYHENDTLLERAWRKNEKLLTKIFLGSSEPLKLNDREKRRDDREKKWNDARQAAIAREQARMEREAG